MLDGLRLRIAQWIAPIRSAIRTYGGARNTLLTGGFGNYSNSSADTELASGLTQLRSRSRQLMRDAPYAKRARVIVVNNVVGAGVGLQAQVKNSRGELHARINTGIEEAWARWARPDSCHTGGALHFSDFERACMGEVFTAGEVFIRMHPRKFGASEVPFALELIEAERMADEFASPGPEVRTAKVKLGVELDPFGRPVAYWLRDTHPGELRFTAEQTTRLTRVPADQIIHLRLIDRWPMTRGEPWLHPVLRKLNDMEEYSAAELTAARMSANYFATLESDNDNPLPTEDQTDGSRQMNIEPGMIDQLPAGEQLKFHTPNRPNAAIDQFIRHMLREVASGVGVSYESLSRDYSQSNYSSSRLALLDDRDLWRVLQQWWVRSLREPLHRAWMQQAVLAGAIPAIPLESFALNQEQFCAVRWKLRGWSWVDPTKEVNAFKEAVKAGFTTVSAVIAQSGGGVDIEDVIAERKQELEMFEEADIEVDTTVEEVKEPPPVAPPAAPVPDDEEADDKTKAQVKHLVVTALNNAALEGEVRGRTDATAEAVLALANAVEQKQTVVNVAGPNINVETPAVRVDAPQITVQPPVVNVAAAEVRVPATVVNVAAAEAPVVNVAPPVVTVNVPEQAAPVVRIETAPPVINVETPPAVVNISTPPLRATRTIVEKHDEKGRIVSTRTEEV